MVNVNVNVANDSADMHVQHSSAGQAQAVKTNEGGGNAFTFQRFAPTPTTPAVYYSANREFYLFAGITITQGSTIQDATLTVPDLINLQVFPATITVRAIQSVNPQFPVFATPFSRNTSGSFGNQPLWDRGKTTGNAAPGAVIQTLTVPTTQTVATDTAIDVTAVVQELITAFGFNNDEMMFRVGGKIITPGQYPTLQTRGQATFGTFLSGGISNITINFTPPSFEEFTIDAILSGVKCVPTSDISNAGAWEDTTFGNSDTNLFNELDELVPDGTGSAVRSITSPTISDTFEVQLGPCTDPGISFGHKIRINARGGSGNQVKIQLFEGVVQIAESGNFVLSNSFQTFEYTLTQIEADSITDYADLRIRVVPSEVP